MRIPVISKDSKPLMPTTPARCRKMLHDGVAEKHWSKEGVFYIKMLAVIGEETQDMCLAIDPGSKYDGYAVAGEQEVALQGMAVLPSLVKKRMRTRSMMRHHRRYRKCRRREARFRNRKTKRGWIPPSQLAKAQLRIRIMQRLCRLYPISDIVIEDVRFNHYKKRWGKYFSMVETGKTKVYAAARELATLWLPRGWDTAQARKDYEIKKCTNKSQLLPESHANDAWAMTCWLYGQKPNNTMSGFYTWRRQQYSRRQLHLQNAPSGGVRGKYGGTTYSQSIFRKGDVINHRSKITGYVGGWTSDGKIVSMTGADGKRIQQFGAGTIKLLARAPNILTDKQGWTALGIEKRRTHDGSDV